MATNYQPGVCNISGSEVKKRKTMGWVFMIGAYVFYIQAVIFQLDNYTLLIFFPLFISFLGFFQAREKFCALYGIAGLENAKDSQNPLKVKDKNKDIKKALKLIFMAFLASLSITSILYIPVLILSVNW